MIPRERVTLEGRRGLVTGIANDSSIAWGCARAFRDLGAELAVTYLNEKALPHVRPLAEPLDGDRPLTIQVYDPEYYVQFSIPEPPAIARDDCAVDLRMGDPYAAADAYAPVLVFEELLRLGLLPKQIPNTSLKLRIRPSKTPP